MGSPEAGDKAHDERNGETQDEGAPDEDARALGAGERPPVLGHSRIDRAVFVLPHGQQADDHGGTADVDEPGGQADERGPAQHLPGVHRRHEGRGIPVNADEDEITCQISDEIAGRDSQTHPEDVEQGESAEKRIAAPLTFADPLEEASPQANGGLVYGSRRNHDGLPCEGINLYHTISIHICQCYYAKNT